MIGIFNCDLLFVDDKIVSFGGKIWVLSRYSLFEIGATATGRHFNHLGRRNDAGVQRRVVIGCVWAIFNDRG